ncbi:MAG: hypothetical protein AAGB05_09880 [Pseudomonadota bacterium]
MSFIRPEAMATLTKWREVALSLAGIAFGGWIMLRGGWFYGVVGGLIGAFALGLALTGWRRMRFRSDAVAPGIVRYDEGAIAYFGPERGGVIALSEISEIAAVNGPTGLLWRISQIDAAPVEIPTGAQAADRLFDTFAALPGARPRAFLDAVEHPPEGQRVLWRRTTPEREAALPRA